MSSTYYFGKVQEGGMFVQLLLSYWYKFTTLFDITRKNTFKQGTSLEKNLPPMISPAPITMPWSPTKLFASSPNFFVLPIEVP